MLPNFPSSYLAVLNYSVALVRDVKQAAVFLQRDGSMSALGGTTPLPRLREHNSSKCNWDEKGQGKSHKVMLTNSAQLLLQACSKRIWGGDTNEIVSPTPSLACLCPVRTGDLCGVYTPYRQGARENLGSGLAFPCPTAAPFSRWGDPQEVCPCFPEVRFPGCCLTFKLYRLSPAYTSARTTAAYRSRLQRLQKSRLTRQKAFQRVWSTFLRLEDAGGHVVPEGVLLFTSPQHMIGEMHFYTVVA